MRNRTVFMSFVLLALFLALAPAASARNTWYVDGVNGSDTNDCKSSVTACKTIGHAISLCSSGDTIMVAPATYTENLIINFSLKIIGSGAATTIVDGGGIGTVFTIGFGTKHVVLSKLTIRNGYTETSGGGINSWGTLTLNNSTITTNSAYDGGGGIFNGVTLTMNNCIISSNTVTGGAGGGIYNEGTLTVDHSTINANSAGVSGGVYGEGGTLTITNSTISGNSGSVAVGIEILEYSKATVNNSTVSGNSATDDGGGIENWGTLTINNSTISENSATWGGGIVQELGSVTLQNSIVANNSAGNCWGTMISFGYNLSSDSTCNFNGPGDMNNTDPRLGTLGNYGGPTQTMPLLNGSPAIDAGNPNGCTDGNGNLLKTDQRGKPRPDKEDTGGCDMGAYEKQSD